MSDSLGGVMLVAALLIVVLGMASTVSDTETEREFDAEAVEQAAFERINDARSHNGHDELSHSESIEEDSESWSDVMADSGEIFHGDPGCAPGGENVAYTYWREDISTKSGSRYYETNAELGVGLANQWLNSSGHRQNIMRDQFDQSGIGVVLIEDGSGRDRVYATQRFCG